LTYAYYAFLFINFGVYVLRQHAGSLRVRFPIGSLEFFIDIILPAPIFPGVDSASNRNEYQEYFQGGTTYHVPNVVNSDSLKLLEPSGSVQACTGIALHLYFSDLCP